MKGIIAKVMKKLLSKPIDSWNIKKDKAREIVEMRPPRMKTHVGCLRALLTLTNLSRTILPNKNLF
jgi:hypothetical protein